jgi:hypothetical protein
MSGGAAESHLKYKHGKWLFSYEGHELEEHVATLPNLIVTSVWTDVSTQVRPHTSAMTLLIIPPYGNAKSQFPQQRKRNVVGYRYRRLQDHSTNRKWRPGRFDIA